MFFLRFLALKYARISLLAKCQDNANGNTIDNAKWSTEQKRELT